ncbi:uncharacterized protein Hap1MRO34_004614 isoform 3-T3 [Clarias gariepinus]|uniref:uncharacterized protein LOC128526199 isoform X3 n=1 Tax=Clarias gariepinus TaxID=13013 RepID=UPI00234CE01F|nr:uncharacterized protein LOC128526199 isoform X3 [Clarias gariepinus]
MESERGDIERRLQRMEAEMQWQKEDTERKLQRLEADMRKQDSESKLQRIKAEMQWQKQDMERKLRRMEAEMQKEVLYRGLLKQDKKYEAVKQYAVLLMCYGPAHNPFPHCLATFNSAFC